MTTLNPAIILLIPVFAGFGGNPSDWWGSLELGVGPLLGILDALSPKITGFGETRREFIPIFSLNHVAGRVGFMTSLLWPKKYPETLENTTPTGSLTLIRRVVKYETSLRLLWGYRFCRCFSLWSFRRQRWYTEESKVEYLNADQKQWSHPNDELYRTGSLRDDPLNIPLFGITPKDVAI